MSPLIIMRVLFGVLFFLLILGAGIMNALRDGAPVLDELSRLASPLTMENVRERQRSAVQRADRAFMGKAYARATRAEIMNCLDKKEMDNFSVIKAADGRLYRGGLYTLATDNAQELAESIAEFTSLVARKGTDVLYLAAPDRVVKGGARPQDMPILDFNPAIDRLLYRLRERGGKSLDSRYVLLDRGFPVERISPRTALLLTGDAAFALFSILIDTLETDFNLLLDTTGEYRSPSSYTVKRYPDFFMGALGHDTGPAFSGLDDFMTVMPTFETDFAVEGLDIMDRPVAVEGTAEETLFNPDALIYYENLYTLYPESFYAHTNLSWSRVTNRLNPTGPRVLFVHDFYTAQLASLLAPLCSELHTLTYQTNQLQSAEDYVSDKTFDLVIVSFFPGNILRPESQTLIYNARPDEEGGDE